MIKVFAPATVGNIGPGFDTLGMAIEGLGDTIEAEKIASGIELTLDPSTSLRTGAGGLPADPTQNTAGIAAAAMLKTLGEPGGVRLRLKKGLPNGSGLGSSAASAAAAAFADDALYAGGSSVIDLVRAATVAEARVSGGRFHDNTAPAIIGGGVLIRSNDPLDLIDLGTITDVRLVVVTPRIQVLTKDARSVLPETVPMRGFVANMANAAAIVAAFLRKDPELFCLGLNDVVIEPARAKLIPGFEEARRAAREAGARGFAISGSGPTVFAACLPSDDPEFILAATLEAFRMEGVECDGLVTTIAARGARHA
jgi:homoserine kinase